MDSQQQFDHACDALKSKNWELKHVDGKAMLLRTVLQSINRSDSIHALQGEFPDDLALQDFGIDQEFQDDEACLEKTSESQGHCQLGTHLKSRESLSYNEESLRSITVYKWDLSCIFDKIWQCPVLYFNIWQEGRVLGHKEVLEIIPACLHQTATPFELVIGQTEHPFLKMPNFYIHPCRTAEVLDGMDIADGDQWLLGWMSAMQQTVLGLRLVEIDEYFSKLMSE